MKYMSVNRSSKKTGRKKEENIINEAKHRRQRGISKKKLYFNEKF